MRGLRREVGSVVGPPGPVSGWVGLVVRVVLAAVWAWASLAKIDDPRTFLRAVRAYDATPEWLSKVIAFGLPMLELTLAVLLLIGLIVRYAAAASAVLLVIFMHRDGAGRRARHQDRVRVLRRRRRHHQLDRPTPWTSCAISACWCWRRS